MECPFKFRLTNSNELNPLHDARCVFDTSKGKHGYVEYPYSISNFTGGPLYASLRDKLTGETPFVRVSEFSDFKLCKQNSKPSLTLVNQLPNFVAAPFVNTNSAVSDIVPVHIGHYVPRSATEFWTIMHELLNHGSALFDVGGDGGGRGDDEGDDGAEKNKHQYWPSTFCTTNLAIINSTSASTVIKLSATTFHRDRRAFITGLTLVAVELMRNFSMFSEQTPLQRSRLPRKVICKSNFCRVAKRKRDGGTGSNTLIATYVLFGKNMTIHHMRCVKEVEKTPAWCLYVESFIRYKWSMVDSLNLGRFSPEQIQIISLQKQWFNSLEDVYAANGKTEEDDDNDGGDDDDDYDGGGGDEEESSAWYDELVAKKERIS